MLQLRQYQRDAIDSIYKYFESHIGNPLIVLPTAAGKSIVAATFIKRAIEEHTDTRILVVTHVKELIAQNYHELIRLWPDAPAGIYSAGLNKRDTQSRILFCGIQSVAKKAYAIQRCDLMIVDEAHLIPRSSETTYKRFINDMLVINPMMKVIGLTATPYRTDSGMLHKGTDRLFTHIAYEAYLNDMIEQGYLSEVISAKTNTQLDVTGVGSRGGEFIAGQLEAAVDVDEVTQAAVSEIVELGAGRKSWLIFCSGVKHAQHVRDAVQAHGVSCEAVLGSTPNAERAAMIDRFKRGELRCLTNANVLTTGFNAPGVDLLAMLRPTKSTGLYVQMVGRGTRLANGKQNCLVLDFAGNIGRHGPIDKVRVRKEPKKSDAETAEGSMPMKKCPECGKPVPINARMCMHCEYEWPVNIDRTASNHAILSKHIKPTTLRCTGINFAKHVGPSGVPTLRVEYQCGLLPHKEWICFEHNGRARANAIVWWRQFVGEATTVPLTVDIALELAIRSAKKPKAIQVAQDGKYMRVVGYEF